AEKRNNLAFLMLALFLYSLLLLVYRIFGHFNFLDLDSMATVAGDLAAEAIKAVKNNA
ncbi:MAG: hypothetical protein MHPSP_002269, partial [Paramarteilia canceri]